MASTYNQIFYEAPGKLIKVNDATNEFIISGYRLTTDENLNRNLLIVNAPTTTGDVGQLGNIAFDKHHIYYCAGVNNWVRGRLAKWESDSDFIDIQAPISPPTNWWNFTSNSLSQAGNYDFLPFGDSTFNINNGYINNSIQLGFLINYSANLIEPSTKNEDFSISFEVKRVNNGFLMGSPFGKLGFHFNFVNTSVGKSTRGAYETVGSNLQFALGAHLPGFTFASYRWTSVGTTSAISNSDFSQIVVTNNASTKQIRIYVNGALEASQSYVDISLGSKYNNPSFQGWAIGASPKGSYFGTPVSSTEYGNNINIRYMGFWKGTVLDQNQINYLYNAGSFRRYPFL